MNYYYYYYYAVNKAGILFGCRPRPHEFESVQSNCENIIQHHFAAIKIGIN